MSIEAREIHRQEQTLLACAEMLRQAEKNAAGLCDDMAGLETGDETFDQLKNAVKQASADMKREMARICSQTVVICDSSKIGKDYFSVIMPLTEVDRILTDDRIDPADHKALLRAEIPLTVVSTKEEPNP